MIRRFAAVAAVFTCAVVWPASALADGHGLIKQFGPGAPGIGDPYFPLDGNGGYDVAALRPGPRLRPGDRRAERASRRSRRRATQNLSRFNLDLDGPDGPLGHGRTARGATWSRDGGELTITPARGLRDGTALHDGRAPTTACRSRSATPSSAARASSPPTTARWSPASRDGGRDLVPGQRPPARQGGVHVPRSPSPTASRRSPTARSTARAAAGGWTTWTWDATEPMASYLATATIGEFDVDAYRHGRHRATGTRSTPTCSTPVAAPRTGDAVRALAGRRTRRYKRLTRTISVPAGGAELSFWVDRDTEPDWDFFFVEAHTVGADDWTTLPDPTATPATDTGNSLPVLAAGSTRSSRTTRPTTATAPARRAAPPASGRRRRGASDGYEQWAVDLSRLRRAGRRGLAHLRQRRRRPVRRCLRRRHRRSRRGEGTTSFEDDGDTLDGWTVPGRARGQPAATRTTGSSAPPPTRPPPSATIVDGVVRPPAGDHRVPRGALRPLPVLDRRRRSSTTSTGSASRWRTRPGRSTRRASSTARAPSDDVVVHELAHQWYGDSLAVARLAAHLAQRGLRDVRRVAVERARGARAPRRRSSTSSTTSSRPTTRSGRRRSAIPGPDAAVRRRRSTPAAR